MSRRPSNCSPKPHPARASSNRPLSSASCARCRSRFKTSLGSATSRAGEKGEIQTLSWPDVDRGAGRIVLRRERSKNGEPRVLPLVCDLQAIIDGRWVAREYQAVDGTTALSPYVFHRDGRPVGDFRKAWESACEAAGVGGTLFHDLRRSAVRNMDRAGVSQSVAMALSGHTTASVYRRYRIVDEDDLREALARMQASLATRAPGSITPIRDAVGARP